MSPTFCQVQRLSVNTLVIVGATCRRAVCFVSPERRAGVACVNSGIRGEPVLEIAHTFDLFTEHTFCVESSAEVHVALS